MYADNDGRLLRRRGSRTEVIAEGLDRSGALTTSGEDVLCLGAGNVLYKFAPDGRGWRVDLSDVGFSDQYQRRDPNRGLLSKDRDTLWVAAGDAILALDLGSANWVSIVAR